jgi:ADP-ribose pyrophosphatase
MMSDPPDSDPRPAFAGEPAGDALIEQRIAGEQVFAGALLDVRRDRVRLPDGGSTIREYVVHPGAVLMVAVRDDSRLVVVRQYRYPQNRVFVEFAAGKLDAGEAPLDTAIRELIEETGYDAVHWTRLGVVHPVIAYSTEAIEIYEARGLADVGAKLDPGEFLEVETCTEADLYRALDEGRLTDAKSIAALTMHSRWHAAAQRSVLLRISGVVQGVGFRDWLGRTAQAARVAGWVRNRRDGSVQAFVQGARDRCDRVIADCRQGPPAARVTRIDARPQPFDAALRRFELRPTS